MLNFRIGFLSSSIGGRLLHPCLPPPFPILRISALETAFRPFPIVIGTSSLADVSMPNMTGRPVCRTMEMIGRYSVSYLARTPCAPYFLFCLIGVETEGFLDYQGKAGIISIVRWNLRPVIFGVECCSLTLRGPDLLESYHFYTAPGKSKTPKLRNSESPLQKLRRSTLETQKVN